MRSSIFLVLDRPGGVLVIYLFTRDERGFDSFHIKNSSIHRLDEIQNFTGTNLQKVAVMINPLWFLVGGLLALSIALLTISYHTPFDLQGRIQ